MSENKEFNGIANYRAFLNGDNAALERLVREYSDALIRYAYCYVKDATLAEDVMEDAFAKLIVKRKWFNDTEHLRAYLYKIVRNRCLDYIRRRKNSLSLDEIEQVMASDMGTQDGLLRTENRNAVYKAMQNLPAQYREVLYLTYFEDYDADELARMLHRTKKQIYNLLHRAKNSLKDLLIKEGIFYEDL